MSKICTFVHFAQNSELRRPTRLLDTLFCSSERELFVVCRIFWLMENWKSWEAKETEIWAKMPIFGQKCCFGSILSSVLRRGLCVWTWLWFCLSHQTERIVPIESLWKRLLAEIEPKWKFFGVQKRGGLEKKKRCFTFFFSIFQNFLGLKLNPKKIQKNPDKTQML